MVAEHAPELPPEAGAGYDLCDLERHLIRSGSDVQMAATTMQLDVHEVEWAIEEHGRCECGQLILTPKARLP